MKALLLIFAVVPSITVALLAWRFWEQDRALENQRTQERLDAVLALIANRLRLTVSGAEEALARILPMAPSEWPNAAAQILDLRDKHAVIVRMEGSHIGSFPTQRLTYYPGRTSASVQAVIPILARGEKLEFRDRNPAAAAAYFRGLSSSQDPSIRGGALFRLARNLVKSGRHDEAIAVYDRLRACEGIEIAGMPAGLLASYARCDILASAGREADLRRAASEMLLALQRGRWRLSAPEFRFYHAEASRWAGEHSSGSASIARSMAIAAGVERLYREWTGSGRITLRSGEIIRAAAPEDDPIVVLWQSSALTLACIVAHPQFLWDRMLAGEFERLRKNRLALTITDADGRTILGTLPPRGGPQSVLSAAELGLPWTLHLTPTAGAGAESGTALRRTLLLVGLASMTGLLIAGLAFASRAAAHEVELARMKSEFVSAVSHEFRTPLATLYQLTEMLSQERVPGEQRRREYYLVILRECSRLRRLVDGLLDFGRIEAGAAKYEMSAVDAVGVALRTVEDFNRSVAHLGRKVEFTADQGELTVHADTAALGRALWNLLDNAVKYSPGGSSIRVEARLFGSEVHIRVSDRGIGIPQPEHESIFGKFVRGSGSKQVHAEGTGIGLATVRHIVKAHRGVVRLVSEPGAGSTFTVALPLVKEGHVSNSGC